MPVNFPPQPVYPKALDTLRTLFSVHDTTESLLAVDNPAWSEEIQVVPVEPDKDEVWADNGFGTINSELFYYDAVAKNQHGKVYKLKRVARNLAGEPTSFNSTKGGSPICSRPGSVVRGLVVAEHHNQLATAISNIEEFIGYNFDPNEETLDFRIRCLRDVSIGADDSCATINFTVDILSQDANAGTEIQFNLQIDGTFNSFSIDFGDGTSTTTQTTGTKIYAPGSAIDPVVIVTSDKCQTVQSPSVRTSTAQPRPATPPQAPVIPLPETPNFPNFEIPDVEFLPPDIIPPTILPPCISLTPVEFPSISVPAISISITGGLPSVISFGPLNIPTFISFSPLNIPTMISLTPVKLPSLISITPVSIPSRINFGTVNIPDTINFGPLEIPTKISFTDIKIPSLISITPIDLPTVIHFDPLNIPSRIAIDAPNIPTEINFGPVNIPQVIDFNSPDIPDTIEIIGNTLPSVISFAHFQWVSMISFAWQDVHFSKISFAWQEVHWSLISFARPPKVSVHWGTPPSIVVSVVVSCPQSSPFAMNETATAFDEGLSLNEMGDPEVKVELGDIGIPSEIFLVAPDLPKVIKLEHDLPNSISVESNIPDVIRFENIPNIPQNIHVKLDSPIPSEIKISSDVPSAIAMVLQGLPTSIPIKVPDDFPSQITLDANIKVTGIPESILLKHDLPESILLKMPENPEIPLVYKGGPLEVAPVEFKVVFDKPIAKSDDTTSCVMIVPCRAN